MLYLPLAVGAVSAFLPSTPLHAPPTRAAVRTTAVPLMMHGDETRDGGTPAASWQEYLQSRGEADLEKTQEEYLTSKTLRLNLDSEFDGGDSGSGAVGDGNVDLEDQHNAVTLGANRGGVTDLSDASSFVGRGNVQSLVDYDSLPNEENIAKGATEARTSSAGKNYFGRSTGLANKLINEMSDEDVKMGRMDCVRAQQKENWFNQRAIHRNNRAQGQGVVFGQETAGAPSEGGFVARENMARSSQVENEISQRDLASHLESLASLPAERLDGLEWGELVISPTDPLDATFEVRASPRQTDVTEIAVRNDYNTFAPFRCGFLPGSSGAFACTPNHGTMNRRSGEPTKLTVRYTPQETGVVAEAILIFETEDFKRIYRFIGST